MTCRGCRVLQLQIVQVGLHVRDVNLAVALAHNLRARYHLRWLNHHLLLLHLLMLLLGVRGCLSLRLGRGLHDLTDFMGGIGGFYPLELLVSRSITAHEAEVRDWLGRLTIDHFYRLGVHRRLLLLVLVLEASAGGVAGLLRTHAQVVKLGLLGSHVAIITVEGAHCSLSAAVQSGLRIRDSNSRLLRRGQLLDEAVG